MQNVITAATFGINLLQSVTPDDIPFKRAIQTAYDYSGAAMLALTAVATTYSYLNQPAPKGNKNQTYHDRLTHVHALVFAMIPTVFLGLETWHIILLSANSLKDYLFLPTHGYHFTTRVAASVGMGALLAWQEGSSLKGAFLDSLFNFALGGLPIYRLISNSISKLPPKAAAIIPTNFINRSIANLGAMKKGEILADLALSIANGPAIASAVQTEKEKRCAEIKTFKFLECDQGPVSRIVQTVMACFRNSQTIAKIEQICTELKAADPCI